MTWLPVVGFEGRYEVSDQGHVRSVPRVVYTSDGRRQPVAGKVLSPCLDGNGYPCVGIAGKRVRVHVLVLEAFAGPRPDGMHGCHADDVKSNNAAANLYWGTRVDNMRDMANNHGGHHNSKKTHCKRGHEFNDENTYYRVGRRQCRPCKRETEAIRSGRTAVPDALCGVHSSG